MNAKGVALVPRCSECEAVWLPDDTDRWCAYLGCDEHVDERGEVFFYCPTCAEREFGDA